MLTPPLRSGRTRATARGAARGFTLIELLVAVAILAILAMVAAPSFNEAILSNKLASYANNFTASATLARSEAIKRNTTVVLCRSADGTTCATSGTWQQGWIVMCTQNPANPGVCVVGGTENLVLQRQQALSPDYHFTAADSAYSLDFLGTGEARITGGGAPATLTLCRATPEPGRQERTLRVSATGRASVEKTTTGVCS